MGIMDAVEGIGYALDTPRALAHGAVANIADAVRGRKSRNSWRASGRDMLESLGVLDANQEGFDAGDVAGMGAEMFLDPLNLVGAGVAAKLLKGTKLSRLGKVANAAPKATPSFSGLAEQVPEIPKLINRTGTPEIAALMGNGPAPTVMPSLHVNDPLGKLRAAAARTAPAKPPAASVAKQPWVRPDIKPGDPLLYSRLERAVEALPDKPMKAQSVINQIKKYPEGVSQEEIDWTDVAGYLKGKTIVDKQDLLNHVKTNRPKINVEGDDTYRQMYGPYIQGRQYTDGFQMKSRDKNIATHGLSLMKLGNPKNPPIDLVPTVNNEGFPGSFLHARSSSFIEPADFRYLLPHFDDISRKQITPFTDLEKSFVSSGMTPSDFARTVKDGRLVSFGSSGRMHVTEGLDSAKELLAKEYGGYKSHNFPGVPNILLHSRSTTRKTPIGKMLLGEEQQSDWLQDASKFGFKGEPLPPAKWAPDSEYGTAALNSQYGVVKSEISPRDTYSASMHPPFDADGGDYKMGLASLDEAKQFVEQRAMENADISRPPRAPMLDSWPELALKQHLIDAASDPSVKYVGLPSGGDVAEVVGGEAGGQAQFYNKDQVARLKKLLKPFGVDVEDVAGAVGKHPGVENDAGRFSNLASQIPPEANGGPYGADYRKVDILHDIMKRYGADVGDTNNLVNDPLPKEKIAEYLRGSLADKFQRRYGAAKLAKITPEMRKQILTKGFPLMSPLAAALLAPALMDRDES